MIDENSKKYLPENYKLFKFATKLHSRIKKYKKACIHNTYNYVYIYIKPSIFSKRKLIIKINKDVTNERIYKNNCLSYEIKETYILKITYDFYEVIKDIIKKDKETWLVKIIDKIEFEDEYPEYY